MWMEHQGKKTTHDFLSLHNKDPSFQLQDSRPPNKGFYLKTYDFLQPLERRGGEEVASEKHRPGSREVTPSVAHVLPGGIGTYSISHVAGAGSPAVKTESGTCADPGKAGYGSYATGVAFALWDQPVTKDTMSRGQWPSPIAARSSGSSFGSLSSSRPLARKRSMERPSGFDDDDDDEEFGGKRDASSHKDLTVKVDGRNSGTDQRPSTPRSKHSATEQRRRSKINDRFQILRELIPHSDQKRDKASFLLEVIEYIRFLQEKVQKYETSYPEWTEENAKLMPWVKVYFRSFWKNARNNSQGPGDGLADPSQVIKNGSAPSEFIFSGHDNSIPVSQAILSPAQHPTESDTSAGVSYKATENSSGFANKTAAAPVSQPNLYASVGRATGVTQSQQLISDADNMASQSQSQWLRSPCRTDCTVAVDTLNEQEELAIDDGMISVSSAYSQGLLTTLSQALESSGIDLSQASISVNINLGKRATNRRPSVTAPMPSAKDYDDPSSGNQVIGSEQASKRQKSDAS